MYDKSSHSRLRNEEATVISARGCDGDAHDGAETMSMSLVVALSRSSCAPRLRGAPDAGEEVDESRRYHKGAQRVVCGVRLVKLVIYCMIERDSSGVR